MNNMKIRTALFQHNMKYWRLAELLGMTDASLSRKLRRELPDSEQEQIVKIIEEESANG